MVSYLLAAYKVSIARACSVVGLHRSMWYYQAKKDDSEVVAKLTELAEKLPTRGFDVYYNRIRTEGLVWNRKRVLRVYRGMKLGMRRRHKKRVPTRIQQPRRVWQLNPLPVFPLTSKLCFDPNLKVLKTLGFWNYT